MLKALLYKEWLKIRWAAILSLLVFAAVIIKMNLYMSYAMRVMNPSDYWYEVIIRGILFLKRILYWSFTHFHKYVSKVLLLKSIS